MWRKIFKEAYGRSPYSVPIPAPPCLLSCTPDAGKLWTPIFKISRGHSYIYDQVLPSKPGRLGGRKKSLGEAAYPEANWVLWRRPLILPGTLWPRSLWSSPSATGAQCLSPQVEVWFLCWQSLVWLRISSGCAAFKLGPWHSWKFCKLSPSPEISPFLLKWGSAILGLHPRQMQTCPLKCKNILRIQ